MSVSSYAVLPAHPWYVVQTRAGREAVTALLLQQQLGLFVYLPQVGPRGPARSTGTPFFPGYLFVSADLTHVGPSLIHTCPGVLRLVGCAGCPQPLPAGALAAIRDAVDRLNAAGGAPSRRLAPGDVVRVKAGPLAGLEAVFLGARSPEDRVRILLDFLGGPREVAMDARLIEPAAPAPGPVHKRGTRGHGRPVRPAGALAV